MSVRVGALAVAVGLLTGCSVADGGGRDHNPAHQPRYVLPDQPEGAERAVRGGAVSAARGKPASFSLVSAADAVRVTVGDLGPELFAISTPAESGAVPRVDVDGSTVVAGLRGAGRPGPVTVVLSDDVRWVVRLAGGASVQTIDLRGGPGGDVDFAAGTARAEVSLPAAGGTQRVVLGGGASQLLVNLAGTAPVRVVTRSGAGEVTVDGQTRSGVPGGAVYTTPGWDTATARFDIEATSGVSAVRVARG